MTPFDRSRFDWYPPGLGGPAVVQSSTGTPRPPLPVPLGLFVVHYGGAGTSWVDPDDTAAELRSVELNHARPNRKPNEYNSVSDSQSVTWEYAGPFRAAHAAGFNDAAWGHLVLLGLESVSEELAQRLIAGVRRARSQAVAAGYLAPDHAVEPHARVGQTSCPGPLYSNRNWWSQIAAPLTAKDDEMNGWPKLVRMAGTPAVYQQHANGTKTWVPDTDVLAVLRFIDPAATITDLPNAAWIAAAGPIVGPIPPGVDGFGRPLR